MVENEIKGVCYRTTHLYLCLKWVKNQLSQLFPFLCLCLIRCTCSTALQILSSNLQLCHHPKTNVSNSNPSPSCRLCAHTFQKSSSHRNNEFLLFDGPKLLSFDHNLQYCLIQKKRFLGAVLSHTSICLSCVSEGSRAEGGGLERT